jgi:hypothetical protein
MIGTKDGGRSGKLKALFRVHEDIVQEMLARGYNHNSPLDKTLAKGKSVQTSNVDSIERQFEILWEKGCSCRIGKRERLKSVAELPTAS